MADEEPAADPRRRYGRMSQEKARVVQGQHGRWVPAAPSTLPRARAQERGSGNAALQDKDVPLL